MITFPVRGVQIADNEKRLFPCGQIAAERLGGCSRKNIGIRIVFRRHQNAERQSPRRHFHAVFPECISKRFIKSMEKRQFQRMFLLREGTDQKTAFQKRFFLLSELIQYMSLVSHGRHGIQHPVACLLPESGLVVDNARNSRLRYPPISQYPSY